MGEADKYVSKSYLSTNDLKRGNFLLPWGHKPKSFALLEEKGSKVLCPSRH